MTTDRLILVNQRYSRLTFLLTGLIGAMLLLFASGCGGGGSSGSLGTGSIPTGSGSGGGTPVPSRTFPGDYFVRLESADPRSFNLESLVNDDRLQEVFVSDPGHNEIDVLSAQDLHVIGHIPVSSPLGMDLSPTGQWLYVAGQTKFYMVSPATLHIERVIELPDTIATNGVILAPYAMADGTVILALGPDVINANATKLETRHLCRWDPATNQFTMVDPSAPIQGLNGNPVRTRDGKHLLVPASNLYLYSTDAQGYVAAGPQAGNYLAASPDGSQYVSLAGAIQSPSIHSVVTFLDANLNPVKQITLPSVEGPMAAPLYTLDGKYLYTFSEPDIEVFDTATFQSAGFLRVGLITMFPPAFLDIDGNRNVFGIWQPDGVAVVNTAHLASSSPADPLRFGGFPSTFANPNTGPVTGGTSVQFVPDPMGSGSADGMTASYQADFGSTPAASNQVGPYPSSSDGGNFLTAVTPPAKNPGPVSVFLTDADNNATILPDAFTYGPKLLRVTPSTVSSGGNDLITVTGYGIGFFQPDQLQVRVGGKSVASASLQSNAYASFDYPEQTLTFPVPSNSPGWSDITVTTPFGSDTIHRGVEYVSQESQFPAGSFDGILYDRFRDRFYLTGKDNTVSVFDPSAQDFVAPLTAPGVSASSVLRAETMTPDGHYLVVADPADQSVVIFDLQDPAQTRMAKALTSSDPTSANGTFFAPIAVTATANNRVFISIAPCIPDPVRELDLTTGTVTPRSDITPVCTTYSPYPEAGAASQDGRIAVFGSGTSDPFSQQIWKYDADSDTFSSGPGSIPIGAVAVNEDASVVALPSSILDGNLQPVVSHWLNGGGGVQLNATGSLMYLQGDGATISVVDTHNGRTLLNISAPHNSEYSSTYFIAVEPGGNKMMIASPFGAEYVQLAEVPLAVGTISPSSGPSGTTIRITGSGFTSATAVTLGGKPATCIETDAGHLTCTVPPLPSNPAAITLTNPDGQTYSYEDAFTVQ